MLRFIKKNLDFILIVIGLAISQLGIIQLICEIPRGSIISIIGAYGSLIPLSIGLFLLSNRIKKAKFFKMLIKVISIVLMVVMVIQLTKLIFGF